MSTHIQFSCPHCQERLRVRREYVGKKVTCNHCGGAFAVPEGDQEAGVSGTAEAAEREEFHAASLALVEAERDQLLSERARLREEIEALRAGSAAASEAGIDESAMLREQLAALTAERDRLAAVNETAERERARLADAAVAAERAMQEAGTRHEQALAGLSRDLEGRLDAERAGWETERKAAAERLASLRHELETHQANSVAEQSRLEKAREQAEARLKAAIADHEKQRDDHARERDALAGRLAEAQRTFTEADEAHKARVQGLDEQLDQLRQQADRAAQERSQWAAQREELHNAIHEARESHQAEIARLTLEAEESRQQTDLAAQRADELAGEVRDLRSELERLGRDADALREQMAAAAEQARAALEAETARSEQLAREVADLAAVRSGLEAELAEARRCQDELALKFEESQNAGNQIRSLLKHIGIHLPQ